MLNYTIDQSGRPLLRAEPLKTLMEHHTNIFEIEKILDRVDAENLTEQEKADLMSLPFGMLNYATRISDLIKWLVRYHAESGTKYVSDIGLLLAIEEVESLRADLLSYATGCIERCNGHEVPCFPCNKNYD